MRQPQVPRDRADRSAGPATDPGASGIRGILVSELLSGLSAIHPDPLPPGTPERTFRWAAMDTPFGRMLLSELDGSIRSLCFLDGREPGRVLAGLKDRWLDAQFLECAEALEPFRRYLVAAMGGEVPRYHALGQDIMGTAATA